MIRSGAEVEVISFPSLVLNSILCPDPRVSRFHSRPVRDIGETGFEAVTSLPKKQQLPVNNEDKSRFFTCEGRHASIK